MLKIEMINVCKWTVYDTVVIWTCITTIPM